MKEQEEKKDPIFSIDSKLPIRFPLGNRIIETAGTVKEISGNMLLITLDISDKNMTPPQGTDMYVSKMGFLYNIVDSSNFPDLITVRVNERQHARVDGVLKVDYANIPETNTQKYLNTPQLIFNKIFGESYRVPEVEDVTPRILYELLYQVNMKMDRILEILEKEHARDYFSADETVNISAAGMRFVSSQEMQLGRIIALRIILPLATLTTINTLGKVVTISDSESEKKYVVSVKFINITEDDKAMITKYVFKRQRELLRG